MLVADTSVLYALFDSNDAHHAKAMKDAGQRRAFTISSEILGETLALVAWRLGRAAAQQALVALTAMPHARIAPSRPWVVERAVASCLLGGPLSFQDWIVVHACRTGGTKPWTFDDDIARAVRA